VSGKWPFPGDLPVDRARQVCLEYRRALMQTDPDACEKIDQAAALVGEGWVSSELASETEDDLVTVARAAELVGRSVRWVYKLTEQDPDLIASRRPIRLRLGDVQDAAAWERARRAGRR